MGPSISITKQGEEDLELRGNTLIIVNSFKSTTEYSGTAICQFLDPDFEDLAVSTSCLWNLVIIL